MTNDPRFERHEQIARRLMPRMGETEESYSARVEYEAAHLTPFWRTVMDIEDHGRQDQPDFDAIGAAWSERHG